MSAAKARPGPVRRRDPTGYMRRRTACRAGRHETASGAGRNFHRPSDLARSAVDPTSATPSVHPRKDAAYADCETMNSVGSRSKYRGMKSYTVSAATPMLDASARATPAFAIRVRGFGRIARTAHIPSIPAETRKAPSGAERARDMFRRRFAAYASANISYPGEIGDSHPTIHATEMNAAKTYTIPPAATRNPLHRTIRGGRRRVVPKHAPLPGLDPTMLLSSHGF